MASNVRFIDALKVGQFKGNKGDQGNTGPTGSGFPFTGSARITGSLDLTGSLDVDGNITASGNISASKLTINTASISKIIDGPDGNANAGITIITSDDTSLEFSDTIIGSTEEYDLTLTSGGALKINNAGSKFSGSAGNITSSGNISASSAIIGKNFTGSSFTGSFFGDGSGLTNLNSGSWDGNFTGSARITGSLDLTGSLDISKNLSASNFLLSGPFSGKIQAKTVDFAENTTINDIISYDGLQAIFGAVNGIDITTLEGKFIQLKTSGSTSLQNKILIQSTAGGTTMTFDTLAGNITASGNISASGDLEIRNITASGNISSSGNIISDTYSGSINTSYFGDEFNVHGNDANSGFTILSLGGKPQLLANSGRLQIGSIEGAHTLFNNPVTASSNFLGTSANFTSNITASGNISASGDLEIRNFTASGNISASGFISASSFSGEGTGLTGVILGTGVANFVPQFSNANTIQTASQFCMGSNSVQFGTSLTDDTARCFLIKAQCYPAFRAQNEDNAYAFGLRPGGAFAFTNVNGNQRPFQIGCGACSNAFFIGGGNDGRNISFATHGTCGNVGIGWTNNSTVPARFTLMGHSTTDIIRVYNSSSAANQLMTFDYQGNLGIGTTSPVVPLQIGDNSSSPQRILLYGANSDNTSSELIFGDSGGGGFPYRGSGIRYNSNLNTTSIRSFYNGTSDADDAVITFIRDTRLVGIGIESPNALLHISSSTSNNRLLQVGDNYLVVTGSNGNIGIGTTSPSTLLQLSGSGGNSSGLSFINGSGEFLRQYFSNENADSDFVITYDGTGGAEITLQHDGDLILNGSNDDDVGIGTTSPDRKLHVQSTSDKVVAKFEHTSSTGFAPGSILLQAGQNVSRGQGMYHYNTVADESWFTGVPYAVDSEKWIVAHNSATTFNTNVAQLTYAIITVDSATDNVGIGTTSPSEKLTVTGSGRVTRIESSDDSVPLVVERTVGNQTRIGFRNDTNNSDFNVSTGANGNSFVINTNNTERVRITNDGNLGLNTTSPGELLTIKGCNNFIAAEHPSYPWGGTNPFGIRMGVAIGSGTNCSGTSGLLDFFRWKGSGTNFVNARIAQNISNISSTYNYGLNFMVDSVSTCITASTSRLYISPNGLIGVGTITPPETFTVEGNISASGGITSSGVIISETMTSGATGSFGTAGTGGSVVLTDTAAESRVTAKNNHLVLRTERDADDIKFKGGDSTSNYAIIEGDTGNFGIGTTSPSEKLSVSGNITATSITASGRIHIADYIEHIGDTNAKFGFSGTDNFEIRTAGSSRLTVDSSGDVGIGTTSPGCTLDVCGVSRVDELDHSQFKLSTNDSISFTSQPKTYAAPPNGYLYHDVLGFDYSYTRTQETSSNGTDFGARSLQKKLFSQKQDQAVTVIESGDVAVRFTFTNVSFILPQFVNFAFTFVSGDIDKQLLVETGDGTSYTTRHTSSATSGVKTVSAFIDSYGSDTHMRITITKADHTSTQTIKMSSLKLLTARAGDQGQGMEFQYPYTYDEDRNIGIGFTQGTPSEDDTRLGIKGSGSDATSNAILAKNSSNTTIFTARNDGLVSVGSNFVVSGSQIDFTNVPTSDPGIAGRLFRDGTDLKISVG